LVIEVKVENGFFFFLFNNNTIRTFKKASECLRMFLSVPCDMLAKISSRALMYQDIAMIATKAFIVDK